MTLNLDKTATTTTAYTRWRARLSERFGENRPQRQSAPAIDLATIMVGIVVVGVLGSVISAAVFAVIPWAQAHQ